MNFKDELLKNAKTQHEFEQEQLDAKKQHDIDQCTHVINEVKWKALEKVKRGEFESKAGSNLVYISVDHKLFSSKAKTSLWSGRKITYSVSEFFIEELHRKAKVEGIKIKDYGLKYKHIIFGIVKKSKVTEITTKQVDLWYDPALYIDFVISF